MRKRLRRILLASLPVVICAALVWWVLPWCVSLPETLLQPQASSLVYTARDGTPLRQLLTADGERVGRHVAFASLPDPLIKATLAAEDHRFWSHGGVDLLAVARAVRDNTSSGRIVSGASTIHQQLIKVCTRKKGRRTIGVKLIEALQARRLSMSWPRERVLSEYLSRISYGNLLTGCTSAASGYFNKPLQDLTVAECALLAAIPQSPTRFNPFRRIDTIFPRQQRILHAMNQHGWISAEQLRVALAEKPGIQRFTGGFAAPHAIELIQGQHPPAPATGIIPTTIDSALQGQVEKIISARLAVLKDRHVTQAAVVVLENATGHILALAGSRDFFASDGGQINGAWAPHSPGSAMKPFTYQLAFERGASAASIVADLPVEYPTPTGIYRPENYAHRLYGPMTYRDALGNSLNIAAVRVLTSIGGADTLLARLKQLGMSTLTEPAEHYGLGLTIGNAPVRLVELTNAYATLARLGVWKPWTLTAADCPGTPMLNPAACYLIADILSDNQARALSFGSYSPLRLPFRAAVKTGTSQSYRDNWTLGYTPEFTVGVWAGNFDNTPMQEVSGVTGAAPIWHDIFLHLQKRHALTWFAEPKGLIHARIDPRTGKRLTAQSPPARISREEVFVQGTLPPPSGSQDYDLRGRAILTNDYATWIRSPDNWMGDVLTVVPSTDSEPWSITNPVPGTVIHLDPDLPGQGRRLILETRPPRELDWHSDTLSIQHDGRLPYIMLQPGRHTLTARDSTTGETQRTYIIVHPE